MGIRSGANILNCLYCKHVHTAAHLLEVCQQMFPFEPAAAQTEVVMKDPVMASTVGNNDLKWLEGCLCESQIHAQI